MLTIGLTGGIATGKSHVLRRFADAGFEVLDLDAVARDVITPGGAAYADVAAAFGPDILAADGSIDRKALGTRVFADASARRRLESLVHPRIRDAEARRLAGGAPGSVAVVDAALLVETGQHLRFARLVVVHCDPREQLRRLMDRDGLPEAAARARLDAQMPSSDKKRFGHYVIDNSSPSQETAVKVDAVIAALRALAVAEPGPARVPVARAARAVGAGPRRGPHGLHPRAVLDECAATGALDLARMAALLDPPHEGPWYAAPARAGDAPPETLAVPVALWSAGRRPGDAPFSVAAAASLARLTHRDPSTLAGAVLAVLAVTHFLTTGDAPSMRARLTDWTAAAAAWTGAAPPATTSATVTAAAGHAGDGEAASREAAAAGGLPDLARALAGGSATAPADPALAERVARVLGGVAA